MTGVRGAFLRCRRILLDVARPKEDWIDIEEAYGRLHGVRIVQLQTLKPGFKSAGEGQLIMRLMKLCTCSPVLGTVRLSPEQFVLARAALGAGPRSLR